MDYSNQQLLLRLVKEPHRLSLTLVNSKRGTGRGMQGVSINLRRCVGLDMKFGVTSKMLPQTFTEGFSTSSSRLLRSALLSEDMKSACKHDTHTALIVNAWRV